jgi:hypothetical protein
MKSTTNEGLWKVEFGELGATLKALQNHGVTPDHLARLRADDDYAKRVAALMVRGGLEGSVHQKLARAILGKNFFGVEDCVTLYGVTFSQKQLRAVAVFPWGEDILNAPCPFYKGKTIRETHFAFLGLNRYMGKPLTIMQWQVMHPATGQPRFYSYPQDCWYKDEKFANDPTCVFRWYLMPLEIVPKSEYKTYQDQVAMLPTEYEVPFAVEEVTKDLLCHRKNGAFLNGSHYGRCQDVSSGGDRVNVGSFDSEGLYVSSWADDRRGDDVGLAASRKLPNLES